MPEQTVKNILESDEFEKVLWDSIELQLRRRERILRTASPMARLKSDPLYTLDKKGIIVPGRIVMEFKLICLKKCRLSRKERDYIFNLITGLLKTWNRRN
jgi:hypothetical protein